MSPWAASRGGSTVTLPVSSPAGSAPSRFHRAQRLDHERRLGQAGGQRRGPVAQDDDDAGGIRPRPEEDARLERSPSAVQAPS
jgi:hypothetical protein